MSQIRVVFSERAESQYRQVQESSMTITISLIAGIDHKVDILKLHPHYGDPIQKRKIPKKYIKEGISNLFRVELPGFWRMMYTIKTEEEERKILIVDILDHRDYNKLFGYRKN